MALCAVLAGCGHVPVMTMIKLRNFDMLRVDPAQLRAAVRMPAALEPRPDGVVLKLSTWQQGDKTSRKTHRFVLQRDDSLNSERALQQWRQKETRIVAFKVAEADIARLRALQREALQRKARSKGKSKGSLSLGADACRRGAFPTGPVLISTFLKPGLAHDFLPLTMNVDLRRYARDLETLLGKLPPCGKSTMRAKM